MTATRSLRVLTSHPEPRPTTNPYITMLAAALRSTPGVEVLTYAPARALLSRYDVVHLHWPETLLGGHRLLGRFGRPVVAVLFLLRLTLTRTPVVRTQHNVGHPPDATRVHRLLLTWFDALTRHFVVLNESTPTPPGRPSTLIPHGHYRDWYGRYPSSPRVPGRVQYFGLVRRYKGVETLVGAFRGIADPSVTLHIAGNPSSEDLVAEIREAAGEDPRISTRFAFLTDAEVVACVSSASLVVLPYRFMHNSGSVLAALSLDRPVLVPDNEVNRALSAEAGPGWVHLYAGDLTSDDIVRALEGSRHLTGSPDLSAREWANAGEAHAAVYRSAAGSPRSVPAAATPASTSEAAPPPSDESRAAAR